MPWWGILLIILGSMAFGGLVIYFAIWAYLAKGLRW